MSASESVRAARARYFARSGLSEAGYHAAWATIRVGPVRLGFPNFAARRALPLHDLHHVATGYGTTWVGEAEISAWELAAGCGRNATAWFFALGAAAIGLVIAPRRVLRAFRRGRSSTTLFDQPFRDELLDLSVSELRQRLRLS